ncbi:MAG: ankyrin repeat domain-containing protein [Bryobacteraceae bacterium]
MTRRILLTAVPGSLALAQKIPDRGPALDLALVKDFVGAAHGNLEKTKALLEQQPGLLNATWDWGGGDFETALGGASHMGNRDIALYLLGKGARLDLFAAAMLGKLDVIRSACAAFPGVHRALGPHKIPLIAHARKGGAEAEPVLKFLESLES